MQNGLYEIGLGERVSRKQNNVPADIVPGERPVRLAPGRESERLEQQKRPFI